MFTTTRFLLITLTL